MLFDFVAPTSRLGNAGTSQTADALGKALASVSTFNARLFIPYVVCLHRKKCYCLNSLEYSAENSVSMYIFATLSL